MTFIDAVKVCFNKFAVFTGRAGRAEFWWFFLFQVLLSVVVGMVSEMLSGVVSLGLLVPGLAVGARRLHDIDKSGWLQLVWLVPLLGWAVMIYWLVQPTGSPNQYGDAPATPAVPVPVPGAQ